MVCTIGSVVRRRYGSGRVAASPASTIRDGPRVVRIRPPEADPSDEVVLVGVGGGGRARGQVELGEHVLQVPGHGVLADHQLGRDLPVGAPAATRRSTSHSRAVSPPRRPSAAAAERAPRRRSGGRRAVRTPRARRRARARPASSSPSARQAQRRPAPAARATSYGISSARQPLGRARSAATPRPASPSASSTAPRAWSATARSSGAPAASAIAASSSARVRAAAVSPAARRISTAAASSTGRATGLGSPRRAGAPRRSPPSTCPSAQAQQREARCGLPARSARRAVRPLGGVQLAAQPVQLALLVAAPGRAPGAAGSASLAWPRSASASASGPGAVGLEDLRPVHEALAAVGHEVGLGRAPVVQGVASTRRRGGGRHVHACLDHRAVDDPGDDRRYLSGGHPHHDLVEVLHALRDATVGDRDLAGQQDAQRAQVVVAGLVAELDDGGRAGRGGHEVAALECSERDRHHQQAAGDARSRSARNEPLAAGLPCVGLGHLSREHQDEPEPERAPCSSFAIAHREPGIVTSTPGDRALLVHPGEIRGDGEPLEIVTLEVRGDHHRARRFTPRRAARTRRVPRSRALPMPPFFPFGQPASTTSIAPCMPCS